MGTYVRRGRRFSTVSSLGAALLLCACAAQSQPVAPSGGQTDACPSHAPVAQVTGVQWYADPGHFSVVDTNRQRQHQERLRPITDMMLDLGRSVDRARNGPDLDCAVGLLRGWARAGALLRTPSEFNGTVERAQFARGLNIVALKLAASDRPVEPATLDWLRRLTRAAIGDFERRNRVDNLYAWSGANAGSFLMLAPDPVASAYEQTVWERAIAAIRPDGLVPTEMERGRRAFVYHQYYLSALLMMRGFREARGIAVTPEEQAALTLLAGRVSSGHCDTAPFAEAAGNIAQEPPGPPDQRVPAAMGGNILTEAYRRCAPAPNHFNQPQLGGRMDLTQSLLERLARDASRR